MPRADRRPIAILMPGLGRDGLGGGAERVAVTLAAEFVRAGRTTDLVLCVTSPRSLREVPDGVRVVDLDSPRLWTALPGLIAYRWRERPSVVLSLMPLANILNVLSAVVAPPGARRAVLSEHNARSIALDPTYDAEGTRLLHPLCRATYPRAAAIVGCAEGVAERLRSVYPAVAGRILAIPNPVAASTSVQDPSPPHPWLGDPTTPCLIAIGRLHAQKDPMTLLAAVARVRQDRQVRLLMLGEGPMRSEVEDEVRRLGLEDAVELLGYVSEPRRLLAHSDLLLHTARWEGFGLVIVEALAEGIPVVATDCPTGPWDILHGGRFGALAGVGDVEALAAEVLATLATPRDPARLRARAAEFEPAAIAGRYLDVLDEAAP